MVAAAPRVGWVRVVGPPSPADGVATVALGGGSSGQGTGPLSAEDETHIAALMMNRDPDEQSAETTQLLHDVRFAVAAATGVPVAKLFGAGWQVNPSGAQLPGGPGSVVVDNAATDKVRRRPLFADRRGD